MVRHVINLCDVGADLGQLTFYSLTTIYVLLITGMSERTVIKIRKKETEADEYDPSFPYFLPSPFLTSCAILPTSFGGKGPHLRR